MFPNSTWSAFSKRASFCAIWSFPFCSAPRSTNTAPLSIRSRASFISWQASTLR